jgi:hypothetical protein
MILASAANDGGTFVGVLVILVSCYTLVMDLLMLFYEKIRLDGDGFEVERIFKTVGLKWCNVSTRFRYSHSHGDGGTVTYEVDAYETHANIKPKRDRRIIRSAYCVRVQDLPELLNLYRDRALGGGDH